MPRLTTLQKTASFLPRKGAVRRSAIPADVLEALNRGVTPTVNLVEWLAVDYVRLAESLMDDLVLPRTAAQSFVEAARAAAALSITRRLQAMGEALHALIIDYPHHKEPCATHTSDIVRSWVALAIRADTSLPFPERLTRLERFADDEAMSTREVSWDSWRPWFAQDVHGGLNALMPWVHHASPFVRRCAIEGTRPRGVWTPHIPLLRERPWCARALLDPVHADPHRYVQNAVANWLNDASKDHPEWVRTVCAEWEAHSPNNPATRYIIRRGQRTIQKSGSRSPDP